MSNENVCAPADQRIVIVGGGHAGGVAAIALRNLGHKGDIAIVGDELWPPYERPALSKELLAGAIEPEQIFIHTKDAFSAAGIELVLGASAVQLERGARMVVLDDGRKLPYDVLLLATGGRLRKLSCPGSDYSNIHYVRCIDDSLRLRPRLAKGQRVLVIGGGLIGLEVAAAANKAGCDVTVWERSQHPVSRLLHPEVSKLFAKLHQTKGVNIRVRTAVSALEAHQQAVTAHAVDGHSVDVDTVVVGIGVEPNVGLAETAGLKVFNGITTDEYGRTSDPHIFAIGDVASRYCTSERCHLRVETWQNAQNQATAFAKTVLGQDCGTREPTWFWTDQYDVNFQFVGHSALEGDLVWRGEPGTLNAIAFHIAENRLVGASCFNPGREMRNVKRLVALGPPIDRHQLADQSIPLSNFLTN